MGWWLKRRQSAGPDDSPPVQALMGFGMDSWTGDVYDQPDEMEQGTPQVCARALSRGL